MIIDLGKTIAKIAKITPGGMLVFFPSYGLLEQCFEIWNFNQVLGQILKFKRIFKEPKDPKEYQVVIQSYYEAIFKSATGGAILMGVCRGRISEGLDFSDNAARCVVLVGIPYPQMADPIVILKKEYLQKKSISDKMSLTGSQWYSQQATRAVNQAIGRVIRHVQDYGVIILLDHRYAY
jgi:regulator of telomere elongation helicase 1